VKRWLAVLPLLALLAACTSSGKPDVNDSTHTTITTITKPRPRPSTAPPSPFTPAPATTVVGLPPGQQPAKGETEGTCPYLSTQDAADTEGNRIYRTTVLTTLHPVGCRFYFWCCDYHATMDIVPQTFATPTAAYNAMVRTGEAGSNVEGIDSLIKGVSAVLYKTKFYGPDGATDWACTFAKGKVMVTVHTNQNDVSFNAKALAQLVAPKF
jgi:hypothetical protein